MGHLLYMKYKCFDCNGDSDDDIMMAIFIMMMVTFFMRYQRKMKKFTHEDAILN